MRILMITENDPAGTAILFAKAVNALTEHTCRLVTTQTRYHHFFEKDLHLPLLDDAGLAALEGLLRDSDVFHFHLLADENYALGRFRPRDYMAGKLLVHHHHGHPDFREHPEKYREKYRRLGRKKLLVSTPDLLRKLPEAMWLPNLVPLDDPLYQPLPVNGGGPMVVSHSPTRKDLKNTDELAAVVGRLRERRPGSVDLDLIDDVRHRECLRRKQHSHVVFDHMQGYYGVSSLEGLSQGKPTIAGLDAWNQATIKEVFGCESLPWVTARDANALEATLEGLAEDPDARKAIGHASRVFMERHWNERFITERLISFYLS